QGGIFLKIERNRSGSAAVSAMHFAAMYCFRLQGAIPPFWGALADCIFCNLSYSELKYLTFAKLAETKRATMFDRFVETNDQRRWQQLKLLNLLAACHDEEMFADALVATCGIVLKRPQRAYRLLQASQLTRFAKGPAEE